jgi:hypothetical protein
MSLKVSTAKSLPTECMLIKVDKWANQVAADNGNTYSVQLPSDIKSGTYVLRTELLALHGNMANLNTTNLAGPQFYPYCFNVEVINGGSAEPEGVKFPGAYKLSDYGIAFSPYMSYKDENGLSVNSKYVSYMSVRTGWSFD